MKPILLHLRLYHFLESAEWRCYSKKWGWRVNKWPPSLINCSSHFYLALVEIGMDSTRWKREEKNPVFLAVNMCHLTSQPASPDGFKDPPPTDVIRSRKDKQCLFPAIRTRSADIWPQSYLSIALTPEYESLGCCKITSPTRD